MYEILEILYLKLRSFISMLFETMTCRTKPEYQECNVDFDDVYTSF